MTKHLLPFFMLLFGWSGLTLQAQLLDDFEDGDLTNPAWEGETSLFQVANGELQLFNQTPESTNFTAIYIPAPTSINQTTTWEFKLRMTFNPSDGNNARVYLTATNPDLQGDQMGYYLQMGESGSDDAIELIRQDGSSKTVLITGATGAIATAPEIGVRVTRSIAGNWELLADYTGGTNYTSQGTVNDTTHDLGQFFGLLCEYSSTRNEDFFLDNVLVDPLYEDTDAPVLLNTLALDANSLLVNFNEPLEITAATTLNNFEIAGIGNPSTAQVNGNQVTLTFSTAFQDGVTYTLDTENIADQEGNIAGTQSANFTFTLIETAAPFDVLINEIMADPTPSLALPEVEFIELYNRSNKSINLLNWSFSSGSTPVLFPDFVLLPNQYVIVTDEEDMADFAIFGEVIGLDGFPALTNSGDDLTLFSDEDELIHKVVYDRDWYQDVQKEDGGYTLELINPLSPCEFETNWIGSNSVTGGTPGVENSVYAPITNEEPLSLVAVFPNDASALTLTFDQAVDVFNAEVTSHYTIDNNVNIISAIVVAPNQVQLAVSPFFEEKIVYTITVQNNVTDCLGNVIGVENSFSFGLPEAIEIGDVWINELLFNPETGGKDFVELYNTSSKILDISDLLIGSYNEEGEQDVKSIDAQFLFLPGEYAVLTSATSDILARYTVPHPENLVETSLPTLEDREDNFIIYALDNVGQAQVIDSVWYSNQYHNELLDDENGVSLEKIMPTGESNDFNNWQSASESVGFATPTGMNSQFFEIINNPAGAQFTLPYTSFAPQGGAEHEFLTIEYTMQQAGFLANILIYDANGRLVKELVQNELLASEGLFVWDGDTDTSRPARMGIYIIWIEIFNPQGEVQRIKETCVLAKQF